jgi:MFS family permease
VSRSPETRTTYHYERVRAATSGMIETAGRTFLLVMAVKHFQTGAMGKAAVAAGGSVGMLLTPLVLWVVTHARWRVAQAASVIAIIGCVGFLLPVIWPATWIFIVGSIIGMAASSAGLPLMTQVYQENYPTAERGRLFSRTVMIRIAAAVVFGDLAGRWLENGVGHYRHLLLAFSVASALAAWCLHKCPSRPSESERGSHPLRPLRHVADDPLFRRTLISWMLMGFANLMMLPLRIEYLANPEKYGLDFHPTAVQIAWITVVVPNIARLLMNPIWGKLFDRMNFFALRMTLNVGFAIGITAFFVSNSLPGLVLGAIVFGISEAGGDVAWNLWVTKFARPDHVSDYMSVHTFLTGCRGVLAPMLAFYVVGQVSRPVLGGVSALFILAATSLLLPEWRRGRGAPDESVIAGKVSE